MLGFFDDDRSFAVDESGYVAGHVVAVLGDEMPHEGGEEGGGHLVEIFADIGGAVRQRHEGAGHGEIDRGGFGSERGNHLERIEPVPCIDHPCGKALRLARFPGPGMEIALGVDHHQRVIVMQDVRDDDACGLVPGRGGKHHHMAIAKRGVHGDEASLALAFPTAGPVGIEALCVFQRVGMFAQHDATLVAEGVAHFAGTGPNGLGQALGLAASGSAVAFTRVPADLLQPGHSPEPRPGHDHEGDQRHDEDTAQPHEALQRGLFLHPQDVHEVGPEVEMFAPEECPFGADVPGPQPVERHAGHPKRPPEGGAVSQQPCGDLPDGRWQDQHRDQGGVVPGGCQRAAQVETGILLKPRPCGQQHRQRDQHRRADHAIGQPGECAEKQPSGAAQTGEIEQTTHGGVLFRAGLRSRVLPVSAK